MREARLNVKLYLLISAQRAVPQGTSRGHAGFCRTLCLGCIRTQAIYYMGILSRPSSFSLTKINHENNSTHWGREKGGAAKLEEYFATQTHQLLDTCLFVCMFVCLVPELTPVTPPNTHSRASPATQRPLTYSESSPSLRLQHTFCGPWLLLPSQALSSRRSKNKTDISWLHRYTNQ